MPVDLHRPRGTRVACAAAFVASAGYALAAAATNPFTWAANVMTAIPIAVVAVSAVARWPARPIRSAPLFGDDHRRPSHPYLGWVVLLATVIGWELLEYVRRGSRSAHPTLSSMADAFDAHHVLKAVAFVAWLWLGAAIVRAGTPVTSGCRGSGAPAS